MLPLSELRFSLDRSVSTGQFSRAGVAWYASTRLFAGAPDTPDALDDLLAHYWEEFQSILRQSAALTDLDLDTEAGVKAASERVNTTDQLRWSVEYWALAVGSALAETVDALKQDDAKRIAWAVNRLTNAHAMLVFNCDLEDTLWRGYLTESMRAALNLWQTNRQNADEEFWQQTLAANPLLLSQIFATPVISLRGKAYVGGKGIENSQGKVTDFLVANRLSENVALIEIKTPKARLLGPEYRAGVYAVSPDLSDAIVQVATQRDALLKEYYALSAKSETSFAAFSPHGFVIAGDFQGELTSPSQRQSFELFRQGLRDVQIVTFDELFARLEALLQSLQGQ